MKEKYINPFTDFGFKKIDAYEESLKVYRDLKNSLDTAKEEGVVEGREKRNLEIAIEMIKNGETDEKIALYTELSKETIEELRKRS